MTVFKTFLKVLNKYKLTVIIYSAFLIFFGAFNMTSNDTATSFVATKPDLLIVNNDEEEGLTKSLIAYLKDNSNIVEVKDDESAIDDALFYRDVNYVIYIPKNFNADFLNGLHPEIEIKSTGDYMSSLANMKLERFLSVANVYQEEGYNEEKIISSVKETLESNTKVELTSSLDTTSLTKANTYFNFASYSLMAGAIQVICLVLSTFRNKNIAKRTIISSENYKTINRRLLLSNMLFSIVLWLIYIIIGFVLLGSVMSSMHGLMFTINSFVFTICCTSLAFLIGNIVTDKNAVNGIVNCVALGSAFLCGAFVPQNWLPDAVLNIAHILPSYWYISSNETLILTEKFNFNTLKPIFINMGVIFIFIIIFIILTNIISKKKQKIA